MSQRPRWALAAALIVACACIAGLTLPPEASAARGLTVGFGDPAFNQAERERALDLSVEAEAQIVRLAVNWGAIAPSRPTVPENPADPAYRFAELDTAVRAADARGLDIILGVVGAPAWAEGPSRPPTSQAPAGTWRPDPGAYGQFSGAVARRYSGAFAAGPGQPTLPRVTRYQAGNEPNLATYLTPQWNGDTPEAARIYRQLLTRFYAAVKGADQQNLVITAGTAPYGDEPGGRRIRPLTFLRELLCLNGSSLAEAGCEARVPFDVLAHHPINAGSPFESADDPADVTTSDIGQVRKVLRKAERTGTVLPAGRHPIWVTEFWWESNPPDSQYGISEKKHARYTAEALYLFWKQRVPLALGLQLVDSPIDTAAPGNSFQTGLFFVDGRAKDALSAFRFPIVAVRDRRTTKVWGRTPAAGKLVIEHRLGQGWRPFKRLRVDRGEIFRGRLDAGGKPRVRARVRGERSLSYRAAKPRGGGLGSA